MTNLYPFTPLAATLLCFTPIFAQPGPQPPCGKQPVSPYPRLDQPAAVQSWNTSGLGRDWMPPACTWWTERGFSTLVATVARFHDSSTAEELLLRIGAISSLKGLRYWSTTHKRWQTLVVEAHALTGPQSSQSRGDFTLDEMKVASIHYFEQTDNLAGKAIYRLRVTEVSADRVAYTVENVSVIRYLLIPLFSPGELQSAYFLDREPENIWRYYSLVRAGAKANRLIPGNESSSINRAVAFYRRLARIPADQEPPAAP
jgi:hypothetical protein